MALESGNFLTSFPKIREKEYHEQDLISKIRDLIYSCCWRCTFLDVRLEKIIRDSVTAAPEERMLWWENSWWTRQRFWDAVQECSGKLKESGFQPSDRIAVFMPDSPMVLILSVAAWNLGGSIVPLNSRGGIEANLRILRKIRPLGTIIADNIRELPEAITEEGLPVVLSPLDKMISGFHGNSNPSGDKDIAVIFATSGTTGNPKTVPLTHMNLWDNTHAVHKHVEGFEEGRIIMNILPNFHAFGYTVCGLLPMLFGLPQVLLPSFIPVNNTFKALREAEVETLIAVPAMLPFLLGSLEKGEARPPSLKYVLTGGGRLDPEMERRVEEKMQVVIFQGYGLTECSPVVAANRSNAAKKTGTIGSILPGYEFQIRNHEGNLLSPDSEGILWVKGPSVCHGYLDSPELNRERFDNEWFNTGDIVKIDEDGYIRVLDRASDLIIVGGFNVYPQEVEEVIQEHSAVNMAAVVGMPHHLTGEYPKAFVVIKEGHEISASEIIQLCKERLAHYKVPRKVEFVDTLPLSPVGKILRRELRKRG